MRPQFNVRLSAKRSINLVHGMWPEDRQRALLTELLEEPTDLSGPDLTEMLELALQDLEPIPCAMKLLQVILDDEMTAGMRDTVARDMLDGMPWIEHSHMNWHRAIYEAAWLAHAAHGSCFTKPRAAKLTFVVEALDDDAAEALNAPLTAALAMRLAAPCMPDALMWRLFEDEINGDAFPEANNLAWFQQWSESDGRTATLTIEGSEHWWGGFTPGEEVTVDAWHDTPPD
ncbi:MAG: hypothetical protein ACJAZO_003407 [Myxococcota bacterium]|jgi:hypothetical protein